MRHEVHELIGFDGVAPVDVVAATNKEEQAKIYISVLEHFVCSGKRARARRGVFDVLGVHCKKKSSFLTKHFGISQSLQLGASREGVYIAFVVMDVHQK